MFLPGVRSWTWTVGIFALPVCQVFGRVMAMETATKSSIWVSIELCIYELMLKVIYSNCDIKQGHESLSLSRAPTVSSDRALFTNYCK